jgi:hypothetical protein
MDTVMQHDGRENAGIHAVTGGPDAPCIGGSRQPVGPDYNLHCDVLFAEWGVGNMGDADIVTVRELITEF